MTDRTDGWRCPKCQRLFFTHGFDDGGAPVCPPPKGEPAGFDYEAALEYIISPPKVTATRFGDHGEQLNVKD